MLKKVLATCDADLYALWLLCISLDDTFGPKHIVRENQRINEAWENFKSVLTDEYVSAIGDGDFRVCAAVFDESSPDECPEYI